MKRLFVTMAIALSFQTATAQDLVPQENDIRTLATMSCVSYISYSGSTSVTIATRRSCNGAVTTTIASTTVAAAAFADTFARAISTEIQAVAVLGYNSHGCTLMTNLIVCTATK